MVWQEDIRPLLALINRIRHEPWSLYRTNELEDIKLFGYDATAQRLDNVQDELKNTQFVLQKINAGKKPVKSPTYVERPGSKTNTTQQPTSLDDVGSFFAGA